MSNSRNPMDCSLPDSSVLFQARILEWVAISFSRVPSQPRDWTQVFCTAGRFFTDWATRPGSVSKFNPSFKTWPQLTSSMKSLHIHSLPSYTNVMSLLFIFSCISVFLYKYSRLMKFPLKAVTCRLLSNIYINNLLKCCLSRAFNSYLTICFLLSLFYRGFFLGGSVSQIRWDNVHSSTGINKRIFEWKPWEWPKELPS